jgi:hypothetical protein
MPALSGCTAMVLSGPFRVLQEGRKSCLPNLGVVAPYYLGKPGKGSKGRLYVPTLWGGGGGFGACPEGVPQVGEPQEKELCAGPPAALGYVDGSGGGGTVLLGGLRVGLTVTACHQHTHTHTHLMNDLMTS